MLYELQPGMALEFAWGGRFAQQGEQPAVWRDECNEIDLKFSPTTVEYPKQKFSPTGYIIFPRWWAQHPRRGALAPLVLLLAPPLASKTMTTYCYISYAESSRAIFSQLDGH
ncbi:hypothetical protein AVEN_160088-1 [Araneus ventricosus]|uniref:Uncharacterized protein n=1 Tax=Araneus ventricosus TaxID=182803 RepID=A0A4Y2GFH7_ARAVE|nr:hypothetical protein AVEN_160088-1 [Araneus ventricosus]